MSESVHSKVVEQIS